MLITGSTHVEKELQLTAVKGIQAKLPRPRRLRPLRAHTGKQHLRGRSQKETAPHPVSTGPGALGGSPHPAPGCRPSSLPNTEQLRVFQKVRGKCVSANNRRGFQKSFTANKWPFKAHFSVSFLRAPTMPPAAYLPVYVQRQEPCRGGKTRHARDRGQRRLVTCAQVSPPSGTEGRQAGRSPRPHQDAQGTGVLREHRQC